MVYCRLLSADIWKLWAYVAYTKLFSSNWAHFVVCTKQTSLTAPLISPCVVAQDIVLERIEQDLSQLPCPQQTVKYLCEVMVPSFSLTWTIPTGDLLEFSTSRDVGEIRNSTDNVYSANLTSRMEDTDPDSDRFFFSSTLLILETVNGSTITCTGAGTDPVEDSTDITLSGE